MNPTRILGLVCDYYGIQQVRVLAGGRSRACVAARQLAIALSAQLTVFSRFDIALALGVDQSTVRVTLQRHQRQLANRWYARDYEALWAQATVRGHALDGRTALSNPFYNNPVSAVTPRPTTETRHAPQIPA